MAAEKYDLVIYGATGFTGKLAVLHTANRYADTIRWAIAGRSKGKLDAVAANEGKGFCNIIVADSSKKESLVAMVKQTKVIATTAGPYARFGTPLVEACVEEGVDYCDITGEIAWFRDMIARYDGAARASGARIVSLCGHDSLPWDLTVYLLASKMAERGEQLTHVDCYDRIRADPSGGTIETAMGIMFGPEKRLRKSDAQKALGFDPLLMLPNGGKSESGLVARNVSSLSRARVAESGSGSIRVPFFMAGVNANAIKRSNALNGYAPKLVYREGVEMRSTFKAVTYILGLLLFGIAVYIPPLRYLLRKFWLPKPGQGPSMEKMKSGYLNIRAVGKGTKGTVLSSNMAFLNGDPGYIHTARMLVEAALCLSLEGEKVNCEGGVLTPGACQKELLVKRLQDIPMGGSESDSKMGYNLTVKSQK